MTLRFQESQLGYFFSKEKLDSTRPPRRQPRNSLPNWIFITSGHFVVNYEGRCKKIQFQPIWSQPASWLGSTRPHQGLKCLFRFGPRKSLA